MTDLVTRLRALADSAYQSDASTAATYLELAGSLRVAADALEQERFNNYHADASQFLKELDALRAKLVEAETNNATLGAARDNLKAAQKLVEHNCVSQKDRRYVVSATFLGKALRAHGFKSVEEAAAFYDALVLRLHGDFAVTNSEHPSTGLSHSARNANPSWIRSAALEEKP